jgi:hypothetical protein
MFVLDRDLLAIEPNVFRDVHWLGQRLSAGTASVAASTLTLTGLDVALDAAGVAAGHVVTIDGVGYEILERLGPASATISRVRASLDDPPIPVGTITARPASIHTFAPQASMVHRQVLAMLGLAENPVEGELGPSAVINPRDVARVEALGVLHAVYAAASALAAQGSPLVQRAEHYRRRFGEARRGLQVWIDIDGDGAPDAMRRPSVLQLVRRR